MHGFCCARPFVFNVVGDDGGVMTALSAVPFRAVHLHDCDISTGHAVETVPLGLQTLASPAPGHRVRGDGWLSGGSSRNGMRGDEENDEQKSYEWGQGGHGTIA